MNSLSASVAFSRLLITFANMRGSRNFCKECPAGPDNVIDLFLFSPQLFFTVLQWFINGLFQRKL